MHLVFNDRADVVVGGRRQGVPVKRTMIRLALFLGSGAVALLVAWLVLAPGIRLSFKGFLTAVVVFSVAQLAVSPLVDRLTRQYAEPLLGGVGLISTFVALLVSTLLSGGLQIFGMSTWIAATVIVWLVTALAGMVAPRLFRKLVPESADAGGSSAGHSTKAAAKAAHSAKGATK